MCVVNPPRPSGLVGPSRVRLLGCESLSLCRLPCRQSTYRVWRAKLSLLRPRLAWLLLSRVPGGDHLVTEALAFQKRISQEPLKRGRALEEAHRYVKSNFHVDQRVQASFLQIQLGLWPALFSQLWRP